MFGAYSKTTKDNIAQMRVQADSESNTCLAVRTQALKEPRRSSISDVKVRAITGPERDSIPKFRAPVLIIDEKRQFPTAGGQAVKLEGRSR